MKKLLGLLLLFTGMVYAQPAITNPQNQTLFDEGNDNYEIFFVHTMAPEILGTLNAGDYTVVFAHDAAYQDPIPEGMYAYFINNETVYVKVTENANPNNFATASFMVFLIPTPVIGQAQDISQIDIPYDYVGIFDLTTQSAAVLNGLAGVNLTYYPSVADAQASTNAIANPAAYANIANPQYVCAKVTNQVTGSYSISPFRLLLTSVETVTIPDPFFKIRVLERYDYNGDGVIQVSEALSVTSLDISNSDMWNQPVYDVTGIENFSNVTQLYIGRNPLGDIDLTSLTNLEYLDMMSTNATSLNVTGLVNLKSINCDTGQLTILDVSTCASLETLLCARNNLTTLNMTGLTGIQFLYCNDNELTSLDVSAFTSMSHLCCSDNALTSLDLTGLNQIISLCYGNQSLGPVDTSNLTNLNYLGYGGGSQTTLDFANLTNLESVWVWNSNITELDVSNLPLLTILRMLNNIDLTYVNMKNGAQFLFSPNPSAYNTEFRSNPNLFYVCTNESDELAVNNQLSIITNTNGAAHAGTYCTFVPGGDYNTITGSVRFDADNNGCDGGDIQQPNIKLKINDGVNTGDTFTNNSGTYNFYTEAGNFEISPQLENAGFFNLSPTTANIAFVSDDNNIANQGFCLTANGVHPDLEIALAPITPARPGFDAVYQLVYKNIGNQVLSGSVTFGFNDAVLDLMSASQTPDLAVTNALTWNYVNLLPFENRSVTITLNVNSPQETPPVNLSDQLHFLVDVTPVTDDENPANNHFELNQIVVGSFDPNDIVCLEGNAVSPDEIGNYLHYLVSFENTGSAQAEQVVVKLQIDSEEFDVSSIQLLNTSHEVFTTITGNIVEFKFPDINLQPSAEDPPVGGHGTVLFKIKTLAGLPVGTEVRNAANIYFDYNFPIATNDANTLFSLLNTPGFIKDSSIVVYPNPATDLIKINCDTTIQSIELYDVQGRILETKLEHRKAAQLDLTNKSKGIYFVKVTTDKGKTVEKVIKE